MPIGKPIEGEANVYLKKVDRRISLRGEYFETPLGNMKLHLSDDRVLFVSAEDWSKVWGAEPKWNIRYRVRPVLAGYGLATVISAKGSRDPEDSPDLPTFQRDRSLGSPSESRPH